MRLEFPAERDGEGPSGGGIGADIPGSSDGGVVVVGTVEKVVDEDLAVGTFQKPLRRFVTQTDMKQADGGKFRFFICKIGTGEA